MSRARRSRRNKRTTDHFTFESEDNNERPTKVPRATSKKPSYMDEIELDSSSDEDDEDRKSTGSFSLLVTLHKGAKKKSVKEAPTAKNAIVKIATANAKFSDDDDDEEERKPTNSKVATKVVKKGSNSIARIFADTLDDDDDDDDEERKPPTSKVTTKAAKKEPIEEEPTAKVSKTKTATKVNGTSVLAAARKYQAGALFAVRNVDSDAWKPEGPAKIGTTCASGLRQAAEDETLCEPEASNKASTFTKPAANSTQSETTAPVKPQENLTESTEKTTTETGPTAQVQPKEATAGRKVVKPTPMPAVFAVVTDAPVATYDSDEEPPKDDPQKCFQWRGDPSVTLSDWTIEIVSGDTDVDTYNVHKVILSYGERHSKYFLNLFCRGRRYTELESNTSRIPLDALAAKALPQLLDFVYKTDGKEALEINTDTATALHHLGSYFEMPRLRWEAKQFWKKDLCLTNATTYFQHARVFHDDKILDGVAEVFAKNIMEIKPSSTIMEISDAPFWASLVAKIDISAPEPNEKAAPGQKTGEEATAVPKPGETSTGAPHKDTNLIQNHLSELILKFAMDHIDELNLATFRALTAPEKLLNVSKKAAMSLMEVEEAITSKTNEQGSLILRDRCVSAIASDWRDMGGMIESSFKKMKRPFLAKLLEKSLENASDDYQKLKEAKEDSDSAHANEISKLKEKYKTKNIKLKDDLDAMTTSRDMYLCMNRNRRNELAEVRGDLGAAQLELATLRSLVPESVRPEPYNKKSKNGAN